MLMCAKTTLFEVIHCFDQNCWLYARFYPVQNAGMAFGVEARQNAPSWRALSSVDNCFCSLIGVPAFVHSRVVFVAGVLRTRDPLATAKRMFRLEVT